VPAFGTDSVCVGPFPARILDLVCEAEHRGDAGKCRWWRRSQPPICLADDSARDTAALKRLLRTADPISCFCFVLRIDCHAMGDIGRALLGNQRKSRINRR
jgi:hypothetical protein